MWAEILDFEYVILLRIVIAAVLGGIIGFERSLSGHSAGLRTHILLCMGSAAVMTLSELLVKKYGCPQEILRMGAQVISGISSQVQINDLSVEGESIDDLVVSLYKEFEI